MNIMCLKSDTSLLVDVLRNFRKICLKVYDLDPAKFVSGPELAWKTALKNTKVKLELLTNIDMLLMVKNELEEEHVTQFINMKKVKNKCIKDYDQNKGFYDDLKN